MRTTLTLDDDVAAKLKAEARRDGRALKEVVNDVLRRGLSARAAARELGCSTASAWRLIRAHATGAVDAHGASRAAEEAPHA